ncbi:MAG: dihydrofolate reductase family protein [Candidatus Sericytochromatia bacterium]|nr:dihydrofolate reductase family protein [Candidatus Sericytochromatia bacterium]
MMTARTRVFVATSLDGFIAGENDDLSWLPEPDPSGDDGGFGAFLGQVGALLMGRKTWDTVHGFAGPWPYGDRPVLVATHRPLPSGHASGRGVAGPIASLVRQGLAAAEGKDLYLDGGEIIRQAMDAGLVDEIVVTFVPCILGRGIPLFAGAASRSSLTCTGHRLLSGGMIQATYVPIRVGTTGTSGHASPTG